MTYNENDPLKKEWLVIATGRRHVGVTEQLKSSLYLRINDEGEFEWVTKL